jgi:hypothetical protein
MAPALASPIKSSSGLTKPSPRWTETMEPCAW